MHLLDIPRTHWQGLMKELKQRGRGQRESGAFLLGRQGDLAGPRMVSAWLNYEVLDARCAKFAYVRVPSEAFPRLWKHCADHDLQVVADVHTHPWGPRQSATDRAHPMISVSGHIALIVPNFAYGDIAPEDVSVNVYHGDSQWTSHYGVHAAALLKLS